MATVGQKLGKNDLEVQLDGRRKVSKELNNKCLHPKRFTKGVRFVSATTTQQKMSIFLSASTAATTTTTTTSKAALTTRASSSPSPSLTRNRCFSSCVSEIPSSPAREINLCENVKLEKPADYGLEKSVYQAKF